MENPDQKQRPHRLHPAGGGGVNLPMMLKMNKIIQQIIRFRKVCGDPKVSKKLMGDIGEYYVLRKLERLGLENVEHRGGHASCDIYIEKIDKKIEVRTSLLKNEGFYGKIKYYGWRIKTRRQKRDNKFDFLVCVALNDDFTKPQFYIFTYKEAYSVQDIPKGRFSNVQKKIHLFQNEANLMKAIQINPGIITKKERVINRKKVHFLNQWKKIPCSPR